MKLIIAGSRTLTPSYSFIMNSINMLDICGDGRGPITEEVCGQADGVDNEGQHWASHYGVPCKLFPADWKKHGKSAGVIRNKQMAEYADALLLIWDGESKGSANMRSQMYAIGKPVYEVILRELPR
jgi:hypothetical protein